MFNFLYCGEDNNSHDKRFIKALERLGSIDAYFQSKSSNFTFEFSKYHAIIVGPLTLELDFLPSTLNVPIIGMSHAFDINETEIGTHKHQRIQSNFEKINRIICDNSYIKETIKKDFKADMKIDLIPYGCDLDELIMLEPNLGGKIRLLSMRNWTTIHANHIIVESLLILASESFLENAIFLGEGPELQQGIARIKNSKTTLQTEFRGFVNMDSLKTAFAESNVYVSSSRSDGSSVSLMEAMAGGLISCVTDHESNRRIIDHGINGFVYKNQSSESLAKTLIEISKLSDEERNVISQNAKTYARRNFNWVSNQELFLKSILEALNAE